MTTEDANAEAIDRASLDIHAAAMRHKFRYSLFGLLMNLDSMFDFIDGKAPADARRAYADLHREIKLFIERGVEYNLAFAPPPAEEKPN